MKSFVFVLFLFVLISCININSDEDVFGHERDHPFTEKELCDIFKNNFKSDFTDFFFDEKCLFCDSPNNELHHLEKKDQLERIVDFLDNHYENMKNKVGSLLRINLEEYQKISILGDTHGQYMDVLRIFQELGPPSKDHLYLFLGDYVDRGEHSYENLMTLFQLQNLSNFEHVYLLRGNHEIEWLNWRFGFRGDELENRFPTYPEIFEAIERIYHVMPVAAVINDGIFCVHGGIGIEREELRNLQNIENARKVGEVRDQDGDSDEDFESHWINEGLLWSDPIHSNEMELKNNLRTGKKQAFGEPVTQKFLEENGLNGIVRAHEASKVKQTGYLYEHGGKVLTIFSAPQYAQRYENPASVATVFGSHDQISEEEGKFEISLFVKSEYSEDGGLIRQAIPMNYEKI